MKTAVDESPPGVRISPPPPKRARRLARSENVVSLDSRRARRSRDKGESACSRNLPFSHALGALRPDSRMCRSSLCFRPTSRRLARRYRRGSEPSGGREEPARQSFASAAVTSTISCSRPRQSSSTPALQRFAARAEDRTASGLGRGPEELRVTTSTPTQRSHVSHSTALYSSRDSARKSAATMSMTTRMRGTCWKSG